MAAIDLMTEPNTQEVTLKWTQIQTTGEVGKRSSHGISVVNSQLVMFGGEIVARNPIDSTLWKLGPLDAEVKNTGADAQDLPPPNWVVINDGNGAAPSPSPRIAHAQTIADDEKLYLFGGRQGITMEESPLNDLWCFNFTTNEWALIEAASAPPSPRSFHKLIAVGNILYVFGGCAAKGRLNDLHSYNIATNEWNQCAAAPEELKGRGGPGFVASPDGSALFVVGGFCGEESNGIWKYDVANNTWSTVLEEGNDALRPFSVSCGVTMNKYLCFFGGEVNPSEKGHEGAGGFTNGIVLLDGTTGLPVKAIVVGDLPRDRGWSDAALLGNSLVVYGGLSGSDEAPERLSDVWRLDMA